MKKERYVFLIFDKKTERLSLYHTYLNNYITNKIFNINALNISNQLLWVLYNFCDIHIQPIIVDSIVFDIK